MPAGAACRYSACQDLNRVPEPKPATCPAESSAGRDDHAVAEEAWATHRRRNDSLVVDTLQGQYKSSVQCPGCQRVCVTFEPFFCLSLPLPVAPKPKDCRPVGHAASPPPGHACPSVLVSSWSPRERGWVLTTFWGLGAALRGTHNSAF